MPDFILRELNPAKFRADITRDIIDALRPVIAASNEPRLVDGDRMAELAAISRPTIDRAVRKGLIPSVKVGRRRLYEPEQVIAALAAANKKGDADA